MLGAVFDPALYLHSSSITTIYTLHASCDNRHLPAIPHNRLYHFCDGYVAVDTRQSRVSIVWKSRPSPTRKPWG